MKTSNSKQYYLKPLVLRVQYINKHTSQRAVVVLRAAPARHQPGLAVVAEEAGDAPAHHLPPLTVAHAARVRGVHQLLAVAVNTTFLLAFWKYIIW